MSVLGLPCYRHKVTGELCSFGRRGQIWENRAGDAFVLFYEPKRLAVRLNRFRKKLGLPERVFSASDECLMCLPKSSLSEVVDLIGLPSQHGRQRRLIPSFC